MCRAKCWHIVPGPSMQLDPLPWPACLRARWRLTASPGPMCARTLLARRLWWGARRLASFPLAGAVLVEIAGGRDNVGNGELHLHQCLALPVLDELPRPRERGAKFLRGGRAAEIIVRQPRRRYRAQTLHLRGTVLSQRIHAF